MKVLIDTNVLISAVWRDKNPEALILWVLGEPDCQWVVSPEIMQEYKEVLHREKFSFPPEILHMWESLLERDTWVVTVSEQEDFPRDQKDAKFLACALASRADYLITGDSDFEDAHKFGHTTILSVSMFKRLIMKD
jgi:putative PIN family toxin of toxin-antitoxin system